MKNQAEQAAPKKPRGRRRLSKEMHYNAYKVENRWLTNKIRRLRRHIKHFPEDLQAQEALALLR